MSDDTAELEAVQRRLEEIQARKRADVRWGMSRHTAERAIEAIAEPVKQRTKSAKAGAGKRRRRKTKKRLL